MKPAVSYKDDLRALPFLIPFLAVFIIFIGYPLFYSLYLSFHRSTIYSDFFDIFGTMEFVGLANYVQALTDMRFLFSIILTLYYAILTIFPGIVFSLFLALLLNYKGAIYTGARSGFFLPNIFDIYVVGVIWLMIFQPRDGIGSVLLNAIGFSEIAQVGVLSIPLLTLPAIALVMVLKNAGFGMILFLTSLNNINESILEAADVDGANWFQKLWYITIPQLKPIILFLSITGLVAAINAFAEIYALTEDRGGSSFEFAGTTLQSARVSGYHLFKIFNDAMYGEAAAISFILLVIAVIIAFLNFRILNPSDR